MSNIEIEDVLSSIRRLVSEDMRPATRLPRMPQPLAGPGKLVLTSALRIVPAAPAAPESPVPADPVPADPGHPAAPGLRRDEAATVVEAAVAALPQDWEPDGSEVVADSATDPDDDWTVEWDSARLAMPLRAAAARPAAAPAEDALPLHAALRAPVHPAVPPTVGGPPPEPAAPAPAPASPLAALAPDVIVWRNAPPAPEAPPEAEAAPEPAAADRSVRPAAMPQPDVIDWQDEPAEASLAADGMPGRDALAGPEDDAPDDGGWLDEDALRDLVRDIIREELQGTLGERITRNVRKLVRAEINRALATRDLD